MTVDARSSPQRLRWLLAAVLLVGALLRVYGLELHSLRNDELSSWNRSNFDTIGQVIDNGVRPDPHPPGWQLILFGVERWVGDSEAQLRAPSVVGGIAAILFVYLLGRSAFSAREGVLAAALTAVSAATIYFSQDARAYSLLLATCTASTWAWIRLVRELGVGVRPGTGTAVAYILFSSAACYLHYLAVVFVGVQALIFACASIRGWSQFRYILAIYLLIALTYLPWIPEFLRDLLHPDGAASWIGRPGIGFFALYIDWAFSSARLLVRLVAVPLLVLLAVRWALGWLGRDRLPLSQDPTALILGLLVVMMATVWIKSRISEPVATPRNLIMLLPLIYVLSARSALTLPGRWLQGLASLLLVAGTLYGLLYEVRYYTQPQKTQFREAAYYAVDNWPGRPDVRIIAWAWDDSYFDYYLERTRSALRISMMAGEKEHTEPLAEFIRQEQPAEIWYLVGHRRVAPEIVSLLEECGQRLDTAEFLDATAMRFQLNEPGRCGQ